MNHIRAKQALLIVGIVGSLTFFYFQIHQLNSFHSQQRGQVLQKLSQWETTLNQDILRVQAGLLSHYDTLGLSMDQIWAGYQILAKGPLALTDFNHHAFNLPLEAYEHQLHEQEKQLAQFKTHHSTLRNSVLFFPMVMDHLLLAMKKQQSPLRLRMQAEQILPKMLLYIERPDTGNKKFLMSLLQKFKNQKGKEIAQIQQEINAAFAHAAIIVAHQDKVNSLAQDLLAMKSEQILQQLIHAHAVQMKHLVHTREQYLIGMYLLGLMLIGYVIVLFIRLQSSAQSLDKANSVLEQRVTERTAKLATVVKTLETEVEERKQTEEHLAVARDEALVAVEAKSAFLATMSHEIRTPMNGVIGMTGLLLETPLNSEQQQYAEIVRSSGELLLMVINDILDFSKIESGKLTIETIDFDLRVALEETLDLLAEKASSKRLELVGWVFADVPTAVQGDPGRLRQVLMNLIGNAIKFSEEGDVSVQVWRLEEDNQEVVVRFQIRDKGIGISPDALERLFSPFSQADSSTTRKYGGTGLGLAICKQLVERMGGELGVESTLGEGSMFWFTVRLGKQAHPLPEHNRPQVTLQGLRVCCVDDHPINRLLMMQYCIDWGMEGVGATTPSEALRILQEGVDEGKPFDLAIVDMEMPEMDGMTLAKTIKATPVLAGTKLVLVTSLGRRGDAALAKEAGFSGYFTKPVKKSHLQASLEWVIGSTEGEEFNGPLITQHTVREREPQESARILVADDYTINQQIAVMMLERIGHRVDVVANGLEAVEALSRKSYDAVLMDCQMPEMDGYEATGAIRKIERERAEETCEEVGVSNQEKNATPSHVPIIAMTANAMQSDREKCLAAGMDDYLSKPIKKEELEDVLARWLGLDKNSKEKEISHIKDEALLEAAPPPSETVSDVLTAPQIDHAVFLEWKTLAGQGYSEFLSKMASQFLEDAELSIQKIQQAIEHENLIQLVETAHGLKGISRNIGCKSLAEVSLELEQHGPSNQNDQNLELCRLLQLRFHLVKEELRLEMERQGLPPVSMACAGSEETGHASGESSNP